MLDYEAFQTELNRLNAEQRAAVEHVEGPLLVVAGPGTGKTQLLSLRAANILDKCDAAPENILCLTYTEAGAEAMRKRLIRLIGRDAYGIEVSTFHGFASTMRGRYPDYFERPSTDTLVSSLRQAEIIDEILKRLPFGTPLASINRGVAASINDIIGFVSKVKRSGVSYEALSAIARQNIAAADWIEQKSTLCDICCMRASAEVIQSFVDELHRVAACATEELRRPVVTTPGTYVPFVRQLEETFDRAELIDEQGKTGGYGKLRDTFFKGKSATGKHLAIREQSEKLLVACEVARSYQERLAELHLYDFDDMIFDFVRAVETDDELRQRLQDQYTFIQVDEFQDTNGAQMRIVELLCDGIESPNVMAVGDDDQAIMRFQGATIDCINQFTELYGPESIVLKTNYRSTPEIVDLGGAIACQIERRLGASADKVIQAFRPSADQTGFSERVFESQEEELDALAKSIRARIDGGYLETCENQDEGIAVIAPKHKSLAALIPYLVAEGVPFAYKETQDLFSSETMQSVLAAIRCVDALSKGRRKLAESYLPQIVCAPEWGGDHPSSVRFALEVRRDHRGRWVEGMEQASDKRIARLHEMLMDWAAKAPSSSVRVLLHEIAAKPHQYWRSQAESRPLAAAQFSAGMATLMRFVEGELDAGRELGRALRLPDVVERLEAAQRFSIKVDVALGLRAPGAVTLTTAHSSKGLEYDCVYLVDADDGTWHRSNSGAAIFPPNLLMGDEKDDDDIRRLVFVALTRAKRHLELFRAGTATLRELDSIVESIAVEPTPESLEVALERSWHDSYSLDTPELAALVDASRDVRHLSASSLNAFVTYEQGCLNSSSFPEEQVMRTPEAPKIFLEFGTVVHALMEDISNKVIGGDQSLLPELIAEHRRQVEWMDFEEKDISQYLDHYDRIVEVFVPHFIEMAAPYRRIAEAKIETSTEAGTPLFGYLDLMLIDDEAKTIQIVDFKTGASSKTYEIPAGYERQLRFYKLMVERSPQFEGYTVVSMGDHYVEPMKGTDELHDPFEVSATPEQIEALERLADCVWRRIQAGAWDTSDFEESELYAQALAEAEKAKPKSAAGQIMQDAYERWLVSEGAL